MEKINTKELKDYLYCPEYWFKRKTDNEYQWNIDISAQRRRYEKRKKRYEHYQKLKKDLFYAKKRAKTKKRKRHTKKKRPNEPIIFLGSLLLAMLVLKSYVLYIFLTGLVIGVLWWLHKNWKQWTVRILEKQLDPYRLLLKELKINPSLVLYDFSSKPPLGTKLEVTYEGNKFYIHLDRSNDKIPGYLRYSKKSDLIELAAQMKIFHSHFFTDHIIGQIKYQNETKTILWKKEKKLTKKMNTLLSGVNEIVHQVEGGLHKNSKPLPFRCAQCPIQSECQSCTIYPKARTSPNEAVEKTYEQFVETASKLLSTSKKHWQNDAKELFNVIQSSASIQKIIQKHCTSSRSFDIEELIETAAFHKTRLFNTTLSKKDELSLAYQLLQYIAYKGRSFKQKTMEDLAGAYGFTKWYDHRTHSDQTIRSFFNTVMNRLIQTIESELQKQIPKEKMEQVIFNLNRSHLNIASDLATIRAEMRVDDDFRDEEEEDADKKDGEMEISTKKQFANHLR
jgi:hypothetical protein